MDAIFEPISLGYSCEVKYQLSRALYRRKFPDGSDDELRRMLMTPEYGQKNFERHIFDWQITPFAAVLEYLRRDFRGVFEREDLHVVGGEVEHRLLKTRHPHEFHAQAGVLDDAAVDKQYGAARSKFDHLAEKFRQHLALDGPFLYVFRDIRIYDEAVELAERLRARNRDRRFLILFVGYEGEDQMLDALKGEVFKAWLPWAADKSANRLWEGDDQRWEQILGEWDLGLLGEDRITKALEADEAPKGEGVAAAEHPRAASWLRRLLARGAKSQP